MPFKPGIQKKAIEETIAQIRKNHLTPVGLPKEVLFMPGEIVGNSKVDLIEGKMIKKIKLEPNKKHLFFEKEIFAYDESIDSHEFLEGTAFAYAMSITRIGKEYENHSEVDFALFSRAKRLCDTNTKIQYSEDPE